MDKINYYDQLSSNVFIVHLIDEILDKKSMLL
jgi:hypothetical protein